MFLNLNVDSDMEGHFCNQHWRSRKKLAIGVDWNCRLCHNGGRRFPDWSAALAHAELHLAGLIMSDKLANDGDNDSDTSSGGFSSSYDCISSEEAESDLSSVSERETDIEDSDDLKLSNDKDKKEVIKDPS